MTRELSETTGATVTSFNFGAELSARIPRYEGAPLAGLVMNVEVYCTGMMRDVSLAYLDGMSVVDIAAVFEIKPRDVLENLKDAIDMIALIVSDPKEIPVSQPINPDDFPDIPGYDEPINNWRDQAACLQTDPELFFDTTENGIRRAKQVCEKCLSKIACLEYALATNEEFGVWGETSEDERAALKSRPVGS